MRAGTGGVFRDLNYEFHCFLWLVLPAESLLCLMNKLNALLKTGEIKTVLLIALLVRLVAVFFAKGFGMHDDHFLVIEAGQSFADGYDYNNWLPWNNNGIPSGHSWFYVGIHYVIFKVLNLLGIADPQLKMVVIRLLHALYSLLGIYGVYRLMQRLSGPKAAIQGAWMMSLLWFVPNASVRNLVEWVCVPPLVWSCYYLVVADGHKQEQRYSLLAGILAGISMGIRFQVIFFIAGMGLYLLWRRKIVSGLVLFFGFIFSLLLTQSADFLFYGYPFAEVSAYINYNIIHATSYFDQPWYNYFLTVGGMLIPPVSLMLGVGFVKGWRQSLVIALPALVFFAFHSYFPNKQERFILPFIPFFLMAGLIGWNDWKTKSQRSFRWERGVWIFFWSINSLGLAVLTTTYSKRSMVEGMYYLYRQPDFTNFVFEVSHKGNPVWPPQFYSGKWNSAFCLYHDYTADSLSRYLQRRPDRMPSHILFFQETQLKERIASFRKKTGFTLQYLYTAQPSYFDKLLHWLNPRNKNEPVFIFRIGRPVVPGRRSVLWSGRSLSVPEGTETIGRLIC